MIWIPCLIFQAWLAFAADKPACTAKELERLDCHLHKGRYDVRVLPQTIAWNDGTWHTVDQMPLNGEAVAWEKMNLDILSGWPVLQLWIWDKGTHETEVQSL